MNEYIIRTGSKKNRDKTTTKKGVRRKEIKERKSTREKGK